MIITALVFSLLALFTCSYFRFQQHFTDLNYLLKNVNYTKNTIDENNGNVYQSYVFNIVISTEASTLTNYQKHVSKALVKQITTELNTFNGLYFIRVMTSTQYYVGLDKLYRTFPVSSFLLQKVHCSTYFKSIPYILHEEIDRYAQSTKSIYRHTLSDCNSAVGCKEYTIMLYLPDYHDDPFNLVASNKSQICNDNTIGQALKGKRAAMQLVRSERQLYNGIETILQPFVNNSYTNIDGNSFARYEQASSSILSLSTGLLLPNNYGCIIILDIGQEQRNSNITFNNDKDDDDFIMIYSSLELSVKCIKRLLSVSDTHHHLHTNHNTTVAAAASAVGSIKEGNSKNDNYDGSNSSYNYNINTASTVGSSHSDVIKYKQMLSSSYQTLQDRVVAITTREELARYEQYYISKLYSYSFQVLHIWLTLHDISMKDYYNCTTILYNPVQSSENNYNHNNSHSSSNNTHWQCNAYWWSRYIAWLSLNSIATASSIKMILYYNLVKQLSRISQNQVISSNRSTEECQGLLALVRERGANKNIYGDSNDNIDTCLQQVRLAYQAALSLQQYRNDIDSASYLLAEKPMNIEQMFAVYGPYWLPLIIPLYRGIKILMLKYK